MKKAKSITAYRQKVNKTFQKIYQKVIESFLDVLILSKLTSGPMSGYDFITFVHNKYSILVSSGTVYSILCSLERDGLIEGKRKQRKRVYVLTDKGKETIEAIMGTNEKIRSFLTALIPSKIEAGTTRPELDMFKREKDAFIKMKDDLLKDTTYAGKFVAIHKGNIVDFGQDNRELAKRVYEKYGYIPIYIGKVEKKRRVVEIPSPELR